MMLMMHIRQRLKQAQIVEKKIKGSIPPYSIKSFSPQKYTEIDNQTGKAVCCINEEYVAEN